MLGSSNGISVSGSLAGATGLEMDNFLAAGASMAGITAVASGFDSGASSGVASIGLGFASDNPGFNPPEVADAAPGAVNGLRPEAVAVFNTGLRPDAVAPGITGLSPVAVAPGITGLRPDAVAPGITGLRPPEVADPAGRSTADPEDNGLIPDVAAAGFTAVSFTPEEIAPGTTGLRPPAVADPAGRSTAEPEAGDFASPVAGLMVLSFMVWLVGEASAAPASPVFIFGVILMVAADDLAVNGDGEATVAIGFNFIMG